MATPTTGAARPSGPPPRSPDGTPSTATPATSARPSRTTEGRTEAPDEQALEDPPRRRVRELLQRVAAGADPGPDVRTGSGGRAPAGGVGQIRRHGGEHDDADPRRPHHGVDHPPLADLRRLQQGHLLGHAAVVPEP